MKKQGAPPLSKDEKIQLDMLKTEYTKLLEKKKTLKMKDSDQSSDSDSDGNKKKKKGGDASSTDSEDEEYLDEVNDNFSPVKH
jgi:hypothetical protein